MRLTDYLPRWTVTGDSGSAPIGPAMTALRSVIARLASVVRCAGFVYIGVQVAIWHSFYLANSWRLAAPVAAMVWAAVITIYLRRRWPTTLFTCIDSAVYVAFALSAQGSVPPGVLDHTFSWLVISMSSQLIVPAWYAPTALSVPLALASPVAYWIGAEQLTGTDSRTTTTAATLLIMVAATHIFGRRQLYRRAVAADAALNEADQAAGEQYVVLQRNIERREHERLLHDTVLNTLTALARAGREDVAEVVSRCRQDVALIESTLSDPGQPGTDAGAGRAAEDLLADLRAVAAEMRVRGLNVHVEIVGADRRAVPAAVATAISNATREALSNVATHAGIGEAWVEVCHIAANGNGLAPERLRVTVRDRGAGFDLARVDQARLGLRRSIDERLTDCGGQAFIWSEPGQGTVVRMSWPAATESAPAATAGRPLVQESLPW